MRILLAEDEKDLSRALVAVLTHNKYEVDAVYDGQEAVEKAKSFSYDCMVFDIMMPKLDGIEALKQIRASGSTSPVIMLTAKAEIEDRINGLDAGADDYLTKPFAMAELLARIRSLTRRMHAYTPSKLSYGNVSLNTAESELTSTTTVRLAAKENKMMNLFLLNPDKQLTSSDIFHFVWPEEEVSHEMVWLYVSYLKNKLEAINANVYIEGEKEKTFILKKR